LLAAVITSMVSLSSLHFTRAVLALAAARDLSNLDRRVMK